MGWQWVTGYDQGEDWKCSTIGTESAGRLCHVLSELATPKTMASGLAQPGSCPTSYPATYVP